MISNKFGSRIKERAGQSLIEILISLAVGTIIIGTAAFSIATMLRANSGIQGTQSATVMSQSLLDSVRSWSGSDWQNVYSLGRGLSNKYFLNASGTTYRAVQGAEGMFDNDVTNGLVGEWKLDEIETSTSTMTYDSTGNGRNGTLLSSPVRATSTCRVGNCMVFNGTSYVSISGVPQSTARTYAWWHNINANGSAVFPSPISQGGYSTGMRVIWRDDSTDITTVQITTGTDVTPTFTLSAGTPDLVGTLYHYVLTYDGVNTGKLYRNGVLVDTKTNGTGAIVNTGTPFYIGMGQYGWKGSVDDVRVYNRVLSANEVSALYKSRAFTRAFVVENICRTANASSTILGSTDSGGTTGSCVASGGAYDPSTLKLSTIANWSTGATTTSLTLTDYLTRWKNAVFYQNNWSGGATGGTYTDTGNTYTTSTNITATSSIRIQGI